MLGVILLCLAGWQTLKVDAAVIKPRSQQVDVVNEAGTGYSSDGISSCSPSIQGEVLIRHSNGEVSIHSTSVLVPRSTG